MFLASEKVNNNVLLIFKNGGAVAALWTGKSWFQTWLESESANIRQCQVFGFLKQ